MDYGFFGSHELRDSSRLVLVVKDRLSKALWACPVPSKGVDNPYGAKCIVRVLDLLGYKVVILKCDQERPIIAPASKAKEMWSGEVVPENSTKGESKSNGEVERAVQEAEGMATTLEEDLETHVGAKIDESIPVMLWLVQHAALLEGARLESCSDPPW